jgi:outer membrane protein insertion porin family
LVWLLVLFAIAPARGQLAPKKSSLRPTSEPASQPAAPISLSPADFVSANALVGLRVSEIQLRGIMLDEQVQKRMQGLVVQAQGEPLDRRKIHDSIQALYATGKFANLQAEAQRTPTGEVTLVFRGTPNYFVGSLSASGAPKRPTDTQLTDATKLQLGEVFTEQKGVQAVARIKAVLADNGYYQAEVTYVESRHDDTQLVDVLFHVHSGPLARVGEVTVAPGSGYTSKQIVDISKLKPGKQVTSSSLSTGLAKLRQKLTKEDHLEAQISLLNRTFNQQKNTLDYDFKIERGPQVKVTVVGMKFRRGTLKKYVPIFEEHAVDDDLLNEGRRNLRDYLQTQGYFNAEVNYHKDLKDANHLEVVYTIEHGSRHDVAEVFVEGNKYLNTEFSIRPILVVQKESTVLPHGRFSQQLAAQDVENIKNQYRANGFQQVQVEYELKDDFEDKANNIAVYYRIIEGPQTRVASLTIEGASASNRAEFPPLNIVQGEPYSQANVDSDRGSILTFYYNNGYANAELEAKSVAAPDDPNRMNVSYKIVEGEQVFVDRVIRAHLTYTRPKYVMREVQIHPGDPLSQQKIYDTQSRLYSLGVFNAVNIAVKNPDGDEQYKDVLMEFQEAKRWTFDYGFGIEASTGQPSSPSTTTNSSGQTVNSTTNPEGTTGVSPRVSFDVTRLNFLGKTNTVGLKSQYGRLEKLGLIRFNAPRLFDNPNLTFSVTAFYDDAINVTTFTSERLEGSVGLNQVISRRANGNPVTTFDYKFTYRLVKASNLVVTPEEIPVLSQPVRVGIPSFTYTRDKRNDPIDATNGNLTTVDLGVASNYFGSQADFGRVIAQNSTYVTFRKKQNSKTGWVFARTLRLGLAEPFNNTTIPLPEEFLAGGSNSLRGFGLNQAGPRDLKTGAPLGGNSLILNSLELRFPPFALPFFGDTISMVAFNDIGNVFSDNTTMFKSLFRFYQPDRSACQSQSTEQQCRFDYMSNTLGAGIRYKTPIGPVRFDLGYNLNPPAFPYFSADSTGNLTVFNTRVTRRVNFFFSIGQAF